MLWLRRPGHLEKTAPKSVGQAGESTSDTRLGTGATPGVARALPSHALPADERRTCRLVSPPRHRDPPLSQVTQLTADHVQAGRIIPSMPVTNEPPTGPPRQDQPRFNAIRTISGTLSPALPFWASQAICVSSYGGSSDCCLHPLPIHILDPGEPDGAEEEAAATAPSGADQRRGRRRRAMARKDRAGCPDSQGPVSGRRRRRRMLAECTLLAGESKRSFSPVNV